MGLTESMHMIAARMGWRLDSVTDVVKPLIAHETTRSEQLTIEPGRVKGVHQVGQAFVGDRIVIELIFHAEIGQPKPQDRVIIRGEPDVESIIPGGIHGDIATCAITANAIPRAIEATPGLHTMTDIAPVSCFQG